MSHYIHHVPGRLRVKAARLCHIDCQTRLFTLLDQLPGIHSYRHNAKAGSLLIHYDETQLNADDILYQLYKAECVDSGMSSALRQGGQGNGLIKQAGTLFGNALFGTLLRKSVETSVLSLARVLR